MLGDDVQLGIGDVDHETDRQRDLPATSDSASSYERRVAEGSRTADDSFGEAAAGHCRDKGRGRGVELCHRS